MAKTNWHDRPFSGQVEGWTLLRHEREWASIDLTFQGWRSADNFNSDGAQLRSLRQIREGN